MTQNQMLDLAARGLPRQTKPPVSNRERLNVAVIDEELPYPLTSGKRIRTVNLLRHLASRHAITFICHRNQDAREAQAAQDYLAQLDIATVVVDPPKRPSTSQASFSLYARLASNLLSPLPYSVQSHTSRQLRRAIFEHGQRCPVDVWHAEWTPCAQSLDLHRARPCVAVAHNVESLIWQRYVETEPHWLRRWYTRGQWRKFCRFERRLFSSLDRLVLVSEADQQLAIEDFSASSCSVVDNGVDIEYFSSVERRPAGQRILFLGSLDWRPNQDAVRWLLEEIFPALRRVAPAAELSLVGRRPPSWMQSKADQIEGVTVHADVPDVRPYMAQSAVMVIPLRVGGGTRLKMLEAAAAGVPVVSTTIGAEGLSLERGLHYLAADGAPELVAKLHQALAAPDSLRALAESARRHVAQHYDWSSLATKLERVWMDCVEQHRKLAPSAGKGGSP